MHGGAPPRSENIFPDAAAKPSRSARCVASGPICSFDRLTRAVFRKLSFLFMRPCWHLHLDKGCPRDILIGKLSHAVESLRHSCGLIVSPGAGEVRDKGNVGPLP